MSWAVIFLVTNRLCFHAMLFSLAVIADFSLLLRMAFYGVVSRDRSRSQERKETPLTSIHAFTHTQTPLGPIHRHLDSLQVFAFMVMRGKKMTRTCSPDSSPCVQCPIALVRASTELIKRMIQIFTY